MRTNRKTDDNNDENERRDGNKERKYEEKHREEYNEQENTQLFNEKMNRLSAFDDLSTTFELREKPLKRIPLGRSSNNNPIHCCNGKRK